MRDPALCPLFPPPPSLQNPQIVEARNLRNADVGGSADPYALVVVAGQRDRTRTKSGTLNPQFQERLGPFALPLPQQRVRVQLWDHDKLSVGGSSADFLGAAEFVATEPCGEQSVWLPLGPRKGHKEDLPLYITGAVHVRWRLEPDSVALPPGPEVRAPASYGTAYGRAAQASGAEDEVRSAWPISKIKVFTRIQNKNICFSKSHGF